MSRPDKKLSLEGLIAVKGGAAPAIRAAPLPEPPPMASAAAQPAPGVGEDLVPLNFRVPAGFKRKFKTYAASHDMFLTELLKLSFEAYQKEREA